MKKIVMIEIVSDFEDFKACVFWLFSFALFY